MARFSKYELSDEEFLELKMTQETDDLIYHFNDSYGVGIIGFSVLHSENLAHSQIYFRERQWSGIGLSIDFEVFSLKAVAWCTVLAFDQENEITTLQEIKEAGFTLEEVLRAFNYAVIERHKISVDFDYRDKDRIKKDIISVFR